MDVRVLKVHAVKCLGLAGMPLMLAAGVLSGCQIMMPPVAMPLAPPFDVAHEPALISPPASPTPIYVYLPEPVSSQSAPEPTVSAMPSAEPDGANTQDVLEAGESPDDEVYDPDRDEAEGEPAEGLESEDDETDDDESADEGDDEAEDEGDDQADDSEIEEGEDDLDDEGQIDDTGDDLDDASSTTSAVDVNSGVVASGDDGDDGTAESVS